MLVTTDLAARGLDQLDVEHVVQFDFAKSAADYVHRCGRTARAGRSGTVTNLVTKHDMGLVRTIRDAQKRGKDLVSAGEEQQKTQRARAQTELKVSSKRVNELPKWQAAINELSRPSSASQAACTAALSTVCRKKAPGA